MIRAGTTRAVHVVRRTTQCRVEPAHFMQKMWPEKIPVAQLYTG